MAYEAFTKNIEEKMKSGALDKVPVFPWHFVALEDLGVKIPTEDIKGVD